jgi:O-acetyl-ADP-ribose deacetylase (regulator of RNase III)
MGTLNYKSGSLLDTLNPERVIAHGVNCRGGFGSGVAGQIAKLYPLARTRYLDRFNTIGWRLGDVQFVQISEQLTIANMATQLNFGYDGKLYVNYGAIRQCFDELLKYVECGNQSVAIPKIGCGLAGGSWQVVEGIVRDCLKKRNVEVTIYSPV